MIGETDGHDALDLGPCCICERTEDVLNVVMLPFVASIPGHGWGCFVCGLPPDGAAAALCTPCLLRWQRDEAEISTICRGYCSEGREPMPEPGTRQPFTHNVRQHQEPAPGRTAYA